MLCSLFIVAQAEEAPPPPFAAVIDNTGNETEIILDLEAEKSAKLNELAEKHPDQYMALTEEENIDPDFYLNLMQIIDHYQISDMETFIDIYLDGGFPALDNITVDEYGQITLNPAVSRMSVMSSSNQTSSVSKDKINGMYSYALNNSANAPQYADQTSDMQFIDPLTGNLTVRQTDITLPGKEGFDLDITRYYNSAQAEFHAKKPGDGGVKTITLHKGDVLTSVDITDQITGNSFTNYYFHWNSDIYYQKKYALDSLGYLEDKDRYLHSISSRVIVDPSETFTYYSYSSTEIEPLVYQRMRNDLGAGWSFGFPSVQGIKDDLNSDGMEDGIYFHTGTGSTYTAEYDVFKGSHVFLETTDTDYIFVVQPDIPSNGIKYIYTDVAGTVYSFGLRGELLNKTDRHGNVISFSYTTKMIYGTRATLLSQIIDTVGRTVNFTYSNDNTLITVTVTDPKDQNNTLTFSYEKEIIYTQTIDSTAYYEPVLKSFTNPLGEKTYYRGENRDINFTFNGKTVDTFVKNGTTKNYYIDKKTIKAYFLTEILYPHSAAVFEFTNERQQYFAPPSGQSNYPEYINKNLGFDGIAEGYRYYHITSTDISDVNNETTNVHRQYNDNYYDCWDNNQNLIDYTGYPYEYSGKLLTANFYRMAYINGTFKEYAYKVADINNPHLVMKYDLTRSNNSSNYIYVVTSYEDFYEGRLPQLIKTRTSDNYGMYETYSEISYYNYTNNYGAQKNRIEYQTRPLLLADFNDANKKLDNQISYEYKYGEVSKIGANQSLDPPLYATEEVRYQDHRVWQIIGETNSTYLYEYTNDQLSKRTIETGIAFNKIKKVEEIYTSATNHAYPSEIREYYTDENEVEQYRSTAYVYDMLTGNIKEKTDINGTTTYQYDLLGRIKKETYPIYETFDTMSTTETYYAEKIYTYSNERLTDIPDFFSTPVYTLKVHEILKYYDSSQNIVFQNEATRYYDGLGNMLRAKIPEIVEGALIDTTTSIVYNENQQIVKVVDPLGNITNISYDFLGRMTEISDPSGVYVNEYETEILSTGTKARSYLVNGPVTEMEQDFNGRTISQTQTIGNDELISRFTYDLAGNLTSYTDPNNNQNSHGVTEKYTYTPYNRLESVVNANNEATYYNYNSVGNITSFSVGGQTQFTKKYNELGAIIEDKDPHNKLKINKYDTLGRLTESTDRNNVVTEFSYDEMNNLSEMSTTNGTGTVQKYSHTTPFGATKIFDGANSITNTYSKLGNTLSKTLSYPDYTATISNSIDALGRLTGFSTSGKHTNYSYQDVRLSKVQLDGNQAKNTADSVNAKYEYYPSGKLKSITYPPLSNEKVLKMTEIYDSLDRLTTLTNTLDTEILSSFEYDYDFNGNVVKIIETKLDNIGMPIDKITNIGYDKLNRISWVEADGKTSAYSYDYRGNRITENAADIYLDESEYSYVYDDLNRLKSVTKTDENSTVTTTLNEYTADGLRYLKQVDTEKTYYVYDNQGRIAAEANASGTVTANYIHAPDRTLAKIESNGAKYYYLHNGHTDVTQIVDMSGNIVNQYSFDIWGNFEEKTEAIHNPFTYFGQQFDESTGLYYLRARYYDPKTGTFTQEDTHWNTQNMLYGDSSNSNIPSMSAISQSSNLYNYGLHNPVSYVDVSGNSVTLTCIILGAVIGAVIGAGVGAAISLEKYGTVTWQFAVGGMLLGSVGGAIIGWGAGAVIASLGVGGTASSIMAGGGASFNSYGDLRKFLGSAGTGRVWHHIVEQNQTYKSWFNPNWIQNTNNVINIDSKVHDKISGYYNSIQEFSNGMRVRDWLVGQDFKTQYEFGIKVLNDFGIKVGQ